MQKAQPILAEPSYIRCRSGREGHPRHAGDGAVSEDGVTAEPDPEAEFEDTSGEADDEEGVSI